MSLSVCTGSSCPNSKRLQSPNAPQIITFNPYPETFTRNPQTTLKPIWSRPLLAQAALCILLRWPAELWRYEVGIRAHPGLREEVCEGKRTGEATAPAELGDCISPNHQVLPTLTDRRASTSKPQQETCLLSLALDSRLYEVQRPSEKLTSSHNQVLRNLLITGDLSPYRDKGNHTKIRLLFHDITMLSVGVVI